MSDRVNMHTFRCCHCGDTTDVRPDELKAWVEEYQNHNSGEIHCEVEGCDPYEGVLVEVRDGELRTQYLNLYGLHDSYGGPEEGGWWYQCGVALGSIPLPAQWGYVDVGGWDGNKVFALRPVIKPVHEEWARNCLNLTAMNDTKNYRITVESHMASDFPRRKPHYE